ncbi:flavodoxin domain-containing protein [Xylanimonas allomyrinae]|uniref:flavodoxin domain-containing protein n=1 Tax=Xylanimonas allomyrinae TaxID=2509459 RepID=UPI0013A62440|nr:flavodoxin domain-containing protein [Xylanimonas allomyrinae]
MVIATKHGTTAEIGARVARALGADVPVLDLAEERDPDLCAFNTVVLGTAVYVSQPLAPMKAFLSAADLGGKRLGLFVSGMVPGPDDRSKELVAAYPPQLRERAVVSAFLSGAFRLDRLNRFERFVVKKTAKVTSDVDAVDDAAIEVFARELAPT